MTPPRAKFEIGQLVWVLQGCLDGFEILGPYPVIRISYVQTLGEIHENYSVRNEDLRLVSFQGACLFPSRSEALLELEYRRRAAGIEEPEAQA